ncbi:hypothetical protein EK21DRAFT_119733 [Setomelanomma holmii]|uniref:Heterokaryon incompatibility domain-containing protein n=1 Tax=Setomelanomma holmii TaxID=210430 RepID=A0A9P4LFP1_9PLEO|nr:hypothetical protein EK21DRAFT_119733 [Setomelanomma holmii]
MMKKVYQNAQMVWVWFGLAEKQERIPEAIDLLPKILVASEQTPQYFSGPRTAEEMKFVKANNLNLGIRYNFLNDSYGLNHIQPDVWSAVMHIMDNPWCHRVWVVQEAALAKDIAFLCGEHRIEFTLLRDVVCSGLVHLYILDTEGRRVDFNGRNSEYVYYARKLVQDRVASTTLRTGPVELSKIAGWVAEHQDCRYAQDRVLGVLGLVDEKFLTQIGDALQTYMGDYSSIAELYTMFTEYLLTNINAQDISWWWWLNQVFTYGRNKDLPSWVPDLHQQAEKYQCRPHRDMMQVRQQGRLLYKASRRHAKGRLGPGSGELTLNGTIIDQISYVHAQQPTYPQDVLSADSSYANLARKIRYIIDMVSWEKTVAEISVHCTGKRDGHDQSKGTQRKCVTMDDYWRTLLADITKQDGATFTYKTYTDFCTIYRKATHTMSTYDIAERHAAGIELFLGVDEEKQVRSVNQEMQNGSGAQGFFTCLAFLQDRQLFLTENERIGFTLKGVQEGDLVCVFNNAWVPHVLRRANDRESEKYRFVGDAYVHGLMYGAADEMDLEVRDITLV